jgi:hypothetical protein
MTKEIKRKVNSGYLVLVILAVAQILTGYGVFNGLRSYSIGLTLFWALLAIRQESRVTAYPKFRKRQAQGQ